MCGRKPALSDPSYLCAFLICLSLIFSSMSVIRLSMCVLFLFLHILWATFRNLLHSILLALVSLSIHFLYAAFFSSIAYGIHYQTVTFSLVSPDILLFVFRLPLLTLLTVFSLTANGLSLPLFIQILTFQIPLPVTA